MTVNGRLTQSTGNERHYVSRGLERGKEYRYEVQAEMDRQGEVVQETKVMRLRAGQNVSIAFDFDDDGSAPIVRGLVTTKLTVNVPDDARIKLAGSETSSTGEVRTFTTSKLAEGAKWENYRIEVTVNQNGQTLTREKLITLVGGESQTLSFDMNATELSESQEIASR